MHTTLTDVRSPQEAQRTMFDAAAATTPTPTDVRSLREAVRALFDASKDMQGILHCWLTGGAQSKTCMRTLKMGVQEKEDARMTFEGTMRCFHHLHADETEMVARFDRPETLDGFVSVARMDCKKDDCCWRNKKRTLWWGLQYSSCTREAMMIVVEDSDDDAE